LLLGAGSTKHVEYRLNFRVHQVVEGGRSQLFLARLPFNPLKLQTLKLKGFGMRSVISNFSRVVWLFMTLVATHNCVQAQAVGSLSEASIARIDLGDFKIDATEVSIGRFAQYANRKNLITAAEREGGGFEYVLGWQRRAGLSP
jgi:hypothetical protein